MAVHGLANHGREVHGFHQRPAVFRRNPRPVPSRGRRRHHQRRPRRGEGGGLARLARGGLEVFHRQGAHEPAHGVHVLARGRAVPHARAAFPGDDQLHGDRLVPAVAGEGAARRLAAFPRGDGPRLERRRRGGDEVHAVYVFARGEDVREVPRAGAPVQLHHTQDVPGAHQAVQVAAAGQARRDGDQHRAPLQRPGQAHEDAEGRRRARRAGQGESRGGCREGGERRRVRRQGGRREGGRLRGERRRAGGG